MPKLCTVLAGETISKGDAVCLSGWDMVTVPMVPRPTVTRATKANLDMLKTIFGVAAAEAADGAVDVLVAGEVADQGITRLGTGLSSSRLVVTKYTLGDANHEAELRYIYETAHEGDVRDVPPVYDAVPEQFVVGTSDKYGNLAIQPRHDSDETGYPKVYNLKAYGAVENWDASNNVPTNDGTANLAAFNRALAAMQSDGNVGAKLVANGRFYFSDTLVLNQTIVFEGTSMNEPTAVGGPVVPDPDGVVTLRRSAPGTWLIFPAMNGAKRVTGIRLHSGALNKGGGAREVDAVPGLAASPADKTILRNLTIHCYHQNDMVPQGADETSALFNPIAGQSHGVHASTTFFAENVTVEFFAGDGFHIMGYYSNPTGSKNDDDYFGGSVDDSSLRNCTAVGSGRDGFHIEGTDAAVCLFDGCVAEVNRRYGFFDSTRGNTYVSCHAEKNFAPGIPLPADGATGAEYCTEGGSNSSTFIGCYAEGNGDRCKFDGPVTVIGGAIGDTNITKDSSAFILEHGVASRAPLVYKNSQGTKPFRISFGDGTETNHVPGKMMIALNWATLNTDGNPDDNTWLRYLDKDDNQEKDENSDHFRNNARYWWAMERNNTLYEHLMRFPTKNSSVHQPAPWFPHGIFLRRDDDLTEDPLPQRVHFTAAPQVPNVQYTNSSEPLSYEIGDVVWNSKPVAGGLLGWICVKGGTQGTANPATFVPFGTIHTRGEDAGQLSINMGGVDAALTDKDVYSATIIHVTNIGAGTTLRFPAPAGDEDSYQRTVRVRDGGNDLNVDVVGGAAPVIITATKTAIVGFDANGAYRVTADA